MTTEFDISLVLRKVETVARAFRERLGTPIWSSEPTLPLIDLSQPVSTLDGLKSRIASMTALFDHFNKTAFDKITGTSSTGTRAAFIAFLKMQFKDAQPAIEQQVEDPIGKICLLRDYLVHAKNRNYRRAIDFFELADPIADYADSWRRVAYKFMEVLDALSSLLATRDVRRAAPDELAQGPLEFMVELLYQRHSDRLADATVSSWINAIIHEGGIRDTELAARFNVDVDYLRRTLYPLTRGALQVRAHDTTSTLLSVPASLREFLLSQGAPKS